MSVHSIAPHGKVQRGKECTEMCTNLIDKAVCQRPAYRIHFVIGV